MRVFVCHLSVWSPHVTLCELVNRYLHLDLCVCVCVCVCESDGEREWTRESVGGFVYSQCKWKSRLKQLLSNYLAKSQSQGFVKTPLHACQTSLVCVCVCVCVCVEQLHLWSVCQRLLTRWQPKKWKTLKHWLISLHKHHIDSFYIHLETLWRWIVPTLHSDKLGNILRYCKIPN